MIEEKNQTAGTNLLQSIHRVDDADAMVQQIFEMIGHSRFFSDFTLYERIKNEWDISSYLSMVTMIVFGAGFLFQLPVIVYFLTKAGLIGTEFLRRYRRHAVVVILVIGAMITPPDPFSQILIAVPLLLLYQFSILIARRIEKRKAKEAREAL